LSGARARIWAHRGASGHAPENTLAAFRLAAEMGADGVELDVHLSRDGQVVVIHNGTVDATTDGRGRVCDLSLADLQALDAGSWSSPRFSGQRIPTLETVLADVGPHMLINVEVKGQPQAGPLEAEVVRLIEAQGLVEQVIVSSFYPGSLKRVRALNPDIQLGYLYSGALYKWLPLAVYRWFAPYDALHPAFRLVDKSYVARAEQHGPGGTACPLNVWTVNDEDDLRRMCDLGVAGIITNYPDRLARILAQD
jgi:glycerophosphoryl diester phosphodiesterase